MLKLKIEHSENVVPFDQLRQGDFFLYTKSADPHLYVKLTMTRVKDVTTGRVTDFNRAFQTDYSKVNPTEITVEVV